MISDFCSKDGFKDLMNCQGSDQMDFSKLSDKELYDIANDESQRMRDRYKAVKELKERREKNKAL